MILPLINRFNANREALTAHFASNEPYKYLDVVKALVEIGLTAHPGDSAYPDPDLDPARITEIDHGDYQGTLVYAIAQTGYQPSVYWSTHVSYGTCSGCDTLEHIRDLPEGETRAKEYVDLALHLVQNMRVICGYVVDGDTQ
jgi:hypothetical protein